MDCPDDNFLSAYCEGLLSDSEAQHARAHLESCVDCSAVLEALTGATKPAAERGDPLVGQLLSGTYRLTSAIGSGGMGRVYAAEQVRLQRRVAVKILGAELCNHPEALERFKREARVCAGLGNRHIVDVLDFNQMPDGTPYMVMELLEGEDLAQRIALNGPLSPARMGAIMVQVCSALACTHDEEILHRDLKPSNIFLCEDEGEAPFIKVLDFGISKARGTLATLTNSKEILGTPSYMSPEMATAQHEQVGPRSDLFALGAIAYEALSGRRAFAGDSIPAVLYNIVHQPPHHLLEVAPGTPPALCALVMQLLEKEPSRRPGSAREVSAALGQIPLSAADTPGIARQPHGADALTLSIPPTSITVTPVGETPLGPKRRPRRLVWLVGLFALCASLLAVAGARLFSRPAEDRAMESSGAAVHTPDRHAEPSPRDQGPGPALSSAQAPFAKEEVPQRTDAGRAEPAPTARAAPPPDAGTPQGRRPRRHRRARPPSPAVDPDPIL